MHRHVAMMHLVNDHIGKISHLGTFVLLPSPWRSGGEINDGGAFAVDPDCLCPHSRSLGKPFGSNYTNFLF